MKVLFATDLHGQPGHLQELAHWARTHRPDLFLLGGDALPDADPADPVGSQVHFLLTEMRRYLEVIKSQRSDINIAISPGNHDWLCTYDAMKAMEREGLLRVIESDNGMQIEKYTFLGYWYAPPCPYAVKDFERLDFSDQAYRFDGGVIWDRQQKRVIGVDGGTYLGQVPTIRDELAQLPRIDGPDWIFVAHAPPLETDLDLLPAVGHVGSQSIKEFILQRQPLLSLHGHIHESPGLSGRFWQYLGQTIAVNPGQRNDGLAAVLIELTEEAVTLTPLGIEGSSGQAPVTLPRPAARRQA